MKRDFQSFMKLNQQFQYQNTQLLYLLITPFAESVCPHYYSKAIFFCKDCENYSPCKICHEIQYDHKLICDHIVCVQCQMKQNISQKCISCNIQFGEYMCDKCGILDLFTSETKPGFHCDQCGTCLLGYTEDFIHCNTCKFCRLKEHICVDFQCFLCLEDLSSSQQGAIKLNCGHFIHKNCKQRMLKSNQFTCGICRKLMLSKQQQIIYNNAMRDKYQQEPISQLLLKKFFWYQCNECSREFIAIQHPIGAMCCNCISFNTSIKQICDDALNCDQIYQEQIKEILIQNECVLQNNVSDLQYYEQLLPKLFSAEILKNYGECNENQIFQYILIELCLNEIDEEELINQLEVVVQEYQNKMTIQEVSLKLLEYNSNIQ
ncbi:CHY zinc finger domain-containing protein [Spironucleus salmonicida]|uniref:CHY zinc finger domain-containing protein n=1 Tax=Spironucleus salmonicida TaxID=348837 RepID=V6LI33_9EUKA|nr:CHY zinc finger domain-containing protein [Spironucleus salmonicida]|eukprot:EST43978.1 CHY zinc finger domain-containing protein [Spironucleus salmonicida]